jgi:non-specific protein-tyrosine kinase
LLGSLLSLVSRGGGALLPGGRRAERALVTLSKPFDAGSEAFRNLRTGILFADPAHKLRTLVITSPLPHEGKSTAAANLAIVMAQAGQRVILVDADMRRPAQHRLFGLRAARGLSLLYLDADPADLAGAAAAALQPTTVPNLWLLDAGPLTPHPAELLASARTPHLIDALKRHADMVIFDTPAMGLLTDAVILASQVDGTILVVRAYATRRDLIKAALAKLATVNARVLGVVLNMADDPGSRYGRYYQRGQYRAAARDTAAPPPGAAAAASVLARANGAETGTTSAARPGVGLGRE